MTYYYWDFDTDNVFLEEDENGDTIAEYTHEPGLYGELIAQERDGQVRYYNFDGQGSTRELTDENGDVTDTYTYTAFGEEIAHTGTTENPFRYKGAWGYYTSSDTNDIYVREQIYEPTNGRWLSGDKLGFADCHNLYLYVHNDPLVGSDPSGLLRETLVGDPMLQSCAAYLVAFQWQLDPTEQNGFIIQSVQTVDSASPCGEGLKITDKVVCDLGISRGNTTKCNKGQGYFELWTVRGGRIIEGANDTFGFAGYSIPTRGSLLKQGAAVFIHASSLTKADQKIIDDFFKGPPDGVGEAGNLRSTCWNKKVADMVSKHSGGFSNSRRTVKTVTKEWDCCCPCPPAEVSLLIEYNVKNIPLGQPNAGELTRDEWSGSGVRGECKDC
jgi:RHS repeat-associated protein